MRCLPTLLVALLSAVFAAVLGGLIAEVGSRAHHVSNMEGGRGWLVLICIVLGFVAGGIIGAIATLLGKKQVKNSVLVAFGADAVAAIIAAALVYLTADRQPTIDGRELALEIEVMLPAGQTTLPEANELKVTTTGIRDQYYPTMELTKATPREGRMVVPGSVPLTSESDLREVAVQWERKASSNSN